MLTQGIDMKLSTFALTASLAAMALPATANAAVYLITYTGTVGGGSDINGEFGTAGASLGGLAFTALFTLTDPTPGAGVTNDGIRGEIYGGTNYGSLDLTPPVSGEITINGVTRTVEGTANSLASQHNGFPSINYDQVYHRVENVSTGSADGISISIGSTVNNIVDSPNYTDLLNYTRQSEDGYTGSFQFQSANGTLIPDSVTIALANVSPVPEPATWAMMIAGFGIVGSAMRRRKTTVSFA